MRGTLFFGALVLGTASLGAGACAMEGSDCTYDGTCPADAVPSGDGGGSGGEGGGGNLDAVADAPATGLDQSTPDGKPPDVITPPNCKAELEARDPLAVDCIVDSYAVFVDALRGLDTYPGTKAQPLKTINAGIAKASGGAVKKSRVYVCGEGPYPERVKMTATENAHVFGGFDCLNWNPAPPGLKAKVVPAVLGYALEVQSVASELRFEDITFEAKKGDATARSSIAAFVVSSPSVSFKRVVMTAGEGFGGGDGAPGTTGVVTSTSSGDATLNGNTPANTIAGAKKECVCSFGATGKSVGGIGGVSDTGGAAGLPNLGAAPPDNGIGGAGAADCNVGGDGHNGAPAPEAPAVSSPVTRGTLDAAGYQPQDGADATLTGGYGQGGGGAGSFGGAGGGGGGCGGCAGSPGKRGEGGGASIAIVAVESPVSILTSNLVAKVAGAGGKGGPGGAGGAGGFGGTAVGNCRGGKGGRGGAGSAASGGAGGISVGVLYKGPKPTVDSPTLVGVVVGALGNGGTGGNGNDGPNGVAEPMKDAAGL